ncbi:MULTISPECIES: hypothetical protein [Actinomycetes]|uniref:Uncharacterized protein n=1 Tax=Streptomyces noursei TaxID=1971 RepID=A0A2N8P427_STRNR|nr:hypothetical protein [Streptomyces noursei]PNE35778.1 hypothetical protein AOB60_43090 [Streptomyces noursei]
MSSTNPTNPTVVPQQSPEEPAAPQRALWPLTVFNAVLVMLLIGAGILYVTWRHPSLGTPVQTAIAGVTVLVTVALALARHR